MNEIDPKALFRLSVLGPIVSRERLEHGELQQLTRELATREYAMPGTQRRHLGEKIIFRCAGLDLFELQLELVDEAEEGLGIGALSRIVQYDQDWKELQRWSFPAALLKRFARSSSSGACLIDGERLLVSGHDARELYALNLPPAGGEARWEATLGFLTAGQAFDVDRSQATSGQGFVLYSIERKTKEVVGARYPALGR